jgi:hypothetical protein
MLNNKEIFIAAGVASFGIIKFFDRVVKTMEDYLCH